MSKENTGIKHENQNSEFSQPTLTKDKKMCNPKKLTKSFTQLSISPQRRVPNFNLKLDLGLFKMNEQVRPQTSLDPYIQSSQATDQKKNELHILPQEYTGRSHMSKNSASSQIFLKFEKTMKDVRDSLHHSPINYT